MNRISRFILDSKSNFLGSYSNTKYKTDITFRLWYWTYRRTREFFYITWNVNLIKFTIFLKIFYHIVNINWYTFKVKNISLLSVTSVCNFPTVAIAYIFVFIREHQGQSGTQNLYLENFPRFLLTWYRSQFIIF